MDYFLLFLALFVSGGWIIVVGINPMFIYGLLLLLVFIILLKKGYYRLFFDGRMVFFIILFISIVVLQDMNFSFNDINIFLKMLTAIFLITYFRAVKKNFFSIFLDVLYGTCILSMIFYLAVIIAPNLTIRVSKEFSTLFGVFAYRSSDITRFGIFRNQAFFWEAGVFGVFIIFAYTLNEYVYEKRYRNIVFYLAAVSTLSMGTILALFAIFIYRKLLYKRSIKTKTYIFFIGCLLILSILWMGIDTTVKVLEYVFKRNILSDSSIFVRMNDFILGFYAGFSRPLLGHGVETYNAYESILLSIYGYNRKSGISNSFSDMFYKYGAIFFGFYIVYMYKGCRNVDRYARFILFFLCIYLLMFEPLSLSVFFLVFLFFEYPKSIHTESVHTPQ